MRIATATGRDLHSASRQLHAALDAPTAVLVFHGEGHETADVARVIHETFPGCSTAGCRAREVLGRAEPDPCDLIAVAFEPPSRASLLPVSDLQAWQFDDARPLLSQLRRPLRRGLGPDLLLLTLSEGILGAEERLIASLASHAVGVPLVGGSASTTAFGDLRTVFANGEVLEGGAVVVMVEPNRPFHAFAAHHFHEGQGRVVVTAARPDERWLDQLEGRPAAAVFEELCGWPAGSLEADPERPQREGVHLGFRAASGLHVRAVLDCKEGSLLLAGAVSEGLVLRLVHAGDLVHRTVEGLHAAIEQVAAPESMLLFSCVGRLHEAQRQDCLPRYLEVQAPVPMAGFFCGAEHQGAMLENFTLCGVLFGAPDA